MPTYYDLEVILIILLFVLFFVGIIVQSSLRAAFKKYSKVSASSGVTADSVARQLIYNAGCNTRVGSTAGTLTDHFNPRNNSVALSEGVYGSDSISALAVAAHEIGHVMQYKEGYAPIKLRNSILPIASIGSNIAPFLIIFGFVISLTKVMWIGIFLYAAVLLFQLITLPVEFNASNRAINMLMSNGYINAAERPAARKVLNMAAMTYVVATLSTLITLLRFILIASSRSNRD